MFNLSDMKLNDIQIWFSGWQAEINTAWLILTMSGLVLLVSALLLIRSRNKLAKHLHEIRNLQHDIRAITAAAIGVGERVLELERRQRRLSERQEQLDIYDPANQPYEQAIHMVKNGADTQELVDMCGISESEAELVALMHRLDQAQPA